MILKVLSLFDSKVKAYAQPYYARSLGEGERAFEQIFVSEDPNPQVQFSHYRMAPQDFHLYHIGDFNDETGELIPCKHVSVCSGNQFLSSPARAKVTPLIKKRK